MRTPILEAAGGVVVVLSALVLFPGCQLRDRSGKDADADEAKRVEEAADQPVFLGNVSLVNEKSRFVLIRTPVNRRFDPGIPLQSFRDGELSGEMLFSPEQTFGFMTADITEGAPTIGDDVYLRHTEDFENGMSDRWKFAMEEFEREQAMGYFERLRYQRKKKKAAKKKKRERERLEKERAGW